MTNADRIRNMSDEQLAKLLGDNCFACPTDDMFEETDCDERNCVSCWLEYLKQECADE